MQRPGAPDVLPRKLSSLLPIQDRLCFRVKGHPATSLGTDVATECGFNGESWARWIVPPPPGKGPPDSPR